MTTMVWQVEHLRQELGAMTRARDEERARAGQLDTRLTAQDIQMRNRWGIVIICRLSNP